MNNQSNITYKDHIPSCESQLMGGFDNKVEVHNAAIKRTFLGIEGHGIFTFSIELEFGVGGQCFGNYALISGSKPNHSISLLKDIINVVGVDSWEKLLGKYVRVVQSHCKVYGIVNITKDTQYLFIDEWFKEHNIDDSKQS